MDRHSPAKVSALDGLYVIELCAGNDHSLALCGETASTRQVYSWGLGTNG